MRQSRQADGGAKCSKSDFVTICLRQEPFLYHGKAAFALPYAHPADLLSGFNHATQKGTVEKDDQNGSMRAYQNRQ